MSKRADTKLFNLHDVRVVRFSIALMLLVFFAQSFFIYRLYSLNQNQLQRELNSFAQESYEIDLNSRLVESLDNKSTKIDSLDIDEVLNSNFNKTGDKHRFNFTKILNIEVEKHLNGFYPIDLTQIDSIAGLLFEANDINLNFYSEIINPNTNEVIRNSMPSQLNLPNNLMISKNILLDQNNFRALRLVLINPLSGFLSLLIAMVILSFVLLVVLIYTFSYLRNMLSEQKKLAQIKNDFFSDVSHEMKKPLSVVSFVISSLSRETISSNKEKRSFYLRMANTEIERMINQTEMVLSLAKDDEGVFELNCVEFDLVELISNLADKYTYISEKEVLIEIYDELDNHLVNADVEQVEYMITNLLTNAVKYSKGAVLIQIKFYLDEDYICISIKDNGMGMSLIQQERVFDKYYRIKTVSTVRGHGIGLNYVRRMVEKHHGILLLNSTLGKGTEFIIKLPQSNRVL